MIAGMVPMALGLGEGGEQTAPLGRAVIGGLVAATFATLLILPSIFAVVQADRQTVAVSLDPDDPESTYYDHVGGDSISQDAVPATLPPLQEQPGPDSASGET